ncbi:MAG: D-alanyl-D-alanine carboxypeptidase [Clostridia bacterium]|nr:D-alanyl-D-alanine carboxypeptidase [Clostridia bacterium]
MLYKKCIALLCAVVLLLVVCLPAAAATPSISSRAAVLIDASTGYVLYEKNAHEPLAMASTTKLMTALLAAETLDWESTVTVPDEAVLVEGSSLGLRGGDTLTVEDLVTGMLLASGNDAANAVALLTCDSLPAFAKKMNERAAAIGMTDSHFVTPSGLDEGEHHSSAYDMALLAGEVLRNDRLAPICAAKQASIHINGVKTTVTNHNKLLKLYADCVGMKTGFTKKAGRCLVSAARRGDVTLIAVTLNGGDYWNDHIKLYDAGFETMTTTELSVPPLPATPVSGGVEATVGLTATPPTVTLPAVMLDALTVRVSRPAFLWAPVSAGQPVGSVIWEYQGKRVAEVPLIAIATVDARPVANTATQIRRLFTALLKALLSEP